MFFRILLFISLFIFFGTALSQQIPSNFEGISESSVNIVSTRDPTWIKYRQVRDVIRQYENYGKPKQFIAPFIRVSPKQKNESMAGLEVQLVGDSFRQILQVDELGYITVPESKIAYDEDAEFFLNRHSGTFNLAYNVSIKKNKDELYSPANLKEACAQIKSFLSDVNGTVHRLIMLTKKCTGVQIVYSGNDHLAGVEYTQGESISQVLPLESNTLRSKFKIFRLPFSAIDQSENIWIKGRPIAIQAIIE
jgi:hypothetical protein